MILKFFLPVYLRAAQIELLHALAAISDENNLGQGIMVKIKFNIIASLYDYNPNLATFMKVRDFLKKKKNIFFLNFVCFTYTYITLYVYHAIYQVQNQW